MKPKHKLSKQVYGLNIQADYIHVIKGRIQGVQIDDSSYKYLISGWCLHLPESNIYTSKKALKTAFNQAFEKLNGVGEPF